MGHVPGNGALVRVPPGAELGQLLGRVGGRVFPWRGLDEVVRDAVSDPRVPGIDELDAVHDLVDGRDGLRGGSAVQDVVGIVGLERDLRLETPGGDRLQGRWGLEGRELAGFLSERAEGRGRFGGTVQGGFPGHGRGTVLHPACPGCLRHVLPPIHRVRSRRTAGERLHVPVAPVLEQDARAQVVAGDGRGDHTTPVAASNRSAIGGGGRQLDACAASARSLDEGLAIRASERVGDEIEVHPSGIERDRETDAARGRNGPERLLGHVRDARTGIRPPKRRSRGHLLRAGAGNGNSGEKDMEDGENQAYGQGRGRTPCRKAQIDRRLQEGSVACVEWGYSSPGPRGWDRRRPWTPTAGAVPILNSARTRRL
jgi:hypothetical protein